MSFASYVEKVVINASTLTAVCIRNIEDGDHNLLFKKGDNAYATPIPEKFEGNYYWQIFKPNLNSGGYVIILTFTSNLVSKFKTVYDVRELRNIWLSNFEAYLNSSGEQNENLVSIWT